MIFEQIFNMINVGLVVLDADLRVRHWNRWMELHSGISAESIVGEPIFSFYPDLNNPKFIRNCKAALKFGNFAIWGLDALKIGDTHFAKAIQHIGG